VHKHPNEIIELELQLEQYMQQNSNNLQSKHVFTSFKWIQTCPSIKT